MKQLVAIIKSQIQQLNNLQLSEWLLSHLKEDANNLTELFAKQFTARSNQAPVDPSFIGQFSSYLSLLSIFYIYAPEFLRQELVDKLLSSPELMFEDKPIDGTAINRTLMEQLTIYREAWPIIVALQKQGAYDLIQILDNAEGHALRSFAALAKGSDLANLVDTFLAKNNKELEVIDRTRLVHFLRQTDLTRWLTEYLERLAGQASNAMSLKLLMLTFTSSSNEFKLADIKALLADYPFPLHRETMQAIISFYYFQLKKQPSSDAIGDFIALFYGLMKRLDLTLQRELVLNLTQECFILIIEQGLEGMASLDLTLQQTGKDLLLLLCCSETGLADKQYRDVIESRLKHLDSYLFDTPELFEVAKDILAAPEAVPEGTVPDLWIETLLTSSRFVAASTPKVLKQLSDRYLALNGEHRLQALWMRLEESCQQQKAHDEGTAENALAVLYRYYGQTVLNLRTDLLLRTVDYIYRPMMNAIIGLDKERSVLLFWFKQYLPLHPFAKAEWPHTASDPIGNADLVQKNTSAQLLARVPEQDLEQAPEGLALLIQNMLHEDSLAELYDTELALLGDAKRLWLAQQLSMAVREADYSISSITWNSLVHHHSNEMLFSLLATMKHESNTRLLFHAILDDEEKRDALFRGLFEPELEAFLEHHDAVVCLADYMAHHHDKPWFSEGLRCFAAYGKKQQKDSLLSDALAQLTKEVDKEETQRGLVDKVLKVSLDRRRRPK